MATILQDVTRILRFLARCVRSWGRTDLHVSCKSLLYGIYAHMHVYCKNNIHAITLANRRCVRKFCQRYLSEKVALSFLCIHWIHASDTVHTDLQVSERLHGGPRFLGKYRVIDCIIITSLTAEK